MVNCYVGDLGSLEAWFNKWLTFFFDEDVHLDSSGSKKLSSRLIVDLSEKNLWAQQRSTAQFAKN